MLALDNALKHFTQLLNNNHTITIDRIVLKISKQIIFRLETNESKDCMNRKESQLSQTK